MLRWHDEAVCSECLSNIENGGQFLIFDPCEQRGFTCSCIGGCCDGEEGLTCIFNQRVGQDRIVVNDTAVVVLARNVECSRNGYNSWCLCDGVEVEPGYFSVRDAADAERSVQCIRCQRNVVAIV